MSTPTTTPTQRRDEAVARAEAAYAALAKARANGTVTTKLTGSIGGPVLAVRNAELELALEGVEFTPWQPPEAAPKRQLNPDELREQIARLQKLAKETPHATVKESAERNVKALQKKLEG